MSGIKIRGTGRCVPQHVVTNDDIAKIVETNDEWITTRTGIRRRHHWRKRRKPHQPLHPGASPP